MTTLNLTTPNISRQPAALTVLFLAEMWERFGFYIVQGMLVLYLTQAFGWSDDKSYTLSGGFTAFVYISPIIGGYIADKILGFKSAILLGGVLLAVGYGLLALATRGEIFLYDALAVIIIGNGFFKPNIGSLLGTFYHAKDPRREAGFTLFYMGINLGTMFSTLSAGFVKDALGWAAGFGMASIGLVFGIISFLLGIKHLAGYGLAPVNIQRTSKLEVWLHSKTAVAAGIILGVPVLTLFLHKGGMATILLAAFAVILLILLFVFVYKQPTLQARRQMLALIFLTLIAVIFWAIFFQIFFSVNLFVERNIDRTFFGYSIPTVAFISFEAIFIVLLSPFLARFWIYCASINRNPSIPVKFFLSFLCMGTAFSILALSTHFQHADSLISPFWIPLAYLFITIGELLLSPIGLSAVTLLAAPRLVGMMMGVWLIAIGYGGKLAGVIAGFSSIPEGIKNKLLESQYYGDAFLKYAVISFIAAVVIFLFVPRLRQLIGDEKKR